MKTIIDHSQIQLLEIADSLNEKVLTQEALEFLIKLHREFNQSRLNLLDERVYLQTAIDEGSLPHPTPPPSDWRIAISPPDLQKRWVEITGPTDRKMMINALNSGANVFMVDFEDANAPTWNNMIHGQLNIMDAVAGTLSYTNPEGKEYKLAEKTAVMMVRPRGWHLYESHVIIDEEPISASLFDFGLAFFHNAKALIAKGSGPYFYLPKLENRLEARLWNNVFIFAQKELDIPLGTIRATVLIETILGALDMEGILYELRDHSAGLNAGRWDYIFSIIKKFSQNHSLKFPDRSQIGMTTPFMRAYAKSIVDVCHRHGAHAIGGMAAFIPSRKDKSVNDQSIAKVIEDKEREASDGFDGTWVAHPDLVPVAKGVFEKALNGAPNQLHLIKDVMPMTALLDFNIPNGTITIEGVKKNISISLQYLANWLNGAGAVAINNLMEDLATAEISRSQLWQWIHHGAATKDGIQITADLYKTFADKETADLTNLYVDKPDFLEQLPKARKLVDLVVLSPTFIDFITLTSL